MELEMRALERPRGETFPAAALHGGTRGLDRAYDLTLPDNDLVGKTVRRDELE